MDALGRRSIVSPQGILQSRGVAAPVLVSHIPTLLLIMVQVIELYWGHKILYVRGVDSPGMAACSSFTCFTSINSVADPQRLAFN